MEKTGFTELKEVFEVLLGPKGCPWDKKQTHESLIEPLEEEVGELIRAIRKKDTGNMKEELGDILLHVMLQSQIASVKGDFNIEDVICILVEKLKRRHPHIFGSEKVKNADEVAKNWEKIKSDEKKRLSGKKK